MVDEVSRPNLLCVLRYHEHEREIVHAERCVEKAIGVHEEDDVFHRFFDKLRIALYNES